MNEHRFIDTNLQYHGVNVVIREIFSQKVVEEGLFDVKIKIDQTSHPNFFIQKAIIEFNSEELNAITVNTHHVIQCNHAMKTVIIMDSCQNAVYNFQFFISQESLSFFSSLQTIKHQLQTQLSLQYAKIQSRRVGTIMKSEYVRSILDKKPKGESLKIVRKKDDQKILSKGEKHDFEHLLTSPNYLFPSLPSSSSSAFDIDGDQKKNGGRMRCGLMVYDESKNLSNDLNIYHLNQLLTSEEEMDQQIRKQEGELQELDEKMSSINNKRKKFVSLQQERRKKERLLEELRKKSVFSNQSISSNHEMKEVEDKDKEGLNDDESGSWERIVIGDYDSYYHNNMNQDVRWIWKKEERKRRKIDQKEEKEEIENGIEEIIEKDDDGENHKLILMKMKRKFNNMRFPPPSIPNPVSDFEELIEEEMIEKNNQKEEPWLHCFLCNYPFHCSFLKVDSKNID